MKKLVKLTVQEFMNSKPDEEIRIIDESKIESEIPNYINHMNKTWSGGRYDEDYRILSEQECREFLLSDDIDKHTAQDIAEQLGIIL